MNENELKKRTIEGREAMLEIGKKKSIESFIITLHDVIQKFQKDAAMKEAQYHRSQQKDKSDVERGKKLAYTNMGVVINEFLRGYAMRGKG